MTYQASACIASPLGLIALFAEGGKLTRVEIGKKCPTTGDSKALEVAKDQLAQYFDGKLTKFSVPSKVEGTEFQKAVWKQIAKLKFGEFASYGEIAEAIGKPLASRAVGAAVGANPIPLIVGCHRVLGSKNAITGYSGGKGIPTKRLLLKHEGIDFRA